MADEAPAAEDIGHGHAIRFLSFAPDRELNPQYKNIPDCDKAMVHVAHPRADGQPGMCASAATLATAPAVLTGNGPTWQVESWEPLTLSPSLFCRTCGDHGFIREGRWVPA
ncbi:DUF6527 family protein [Actinocrispum wychmicini]|uniref:Uncharacterized protein n=1 Tax=Actinocrispum wychmicini TaxID=1213861 RepID=A0A4R2JJE3_9PSEU|nr:DUF6527 family protein [Actinocrispum wychmicini]TCO57128.1 hypothetical protein EV192_106605 [Actinocrispum wychmicini]